MLELVKWLHELLEDVAGVLRQLQDAEAALEHARPEDKVDLRAKVQRLTRELDQHCQRLSLIEAQVAAQLCQEVQTLNVAGAHCARALYGAAVNQAWHMQACTVGSQKLREQQHAPLLRDCGLRA